MSRKQRVGLKKKRGEEKNFLSLRLLEKCRKITFSHLQYYTAKEKNSSNKDFQH